MFDATCTVGLRAKLAAMTITSAPWHHPRPEHPRLHLDAVPAGVIHALADRDPSASAIHHVSPYLAGPECRRLWQIRSKQIKDSPDDAPWITRLIVDPELPMPVGVAGFHGPPDETGMVEIGYRVDTDLRRRGYAKRSVETLLAVAQRHQDVLTVRATISPDNAPSLSLINSFGFVEVGEQWDEEDGIEVIYELLASAVQSSVQ